MSFHGAGDLCHTTRHGASGRPLSAPATSADAVTRSAIRKGFGKSRRAPSIWATPRARGESAARPEMRMTGSAGRWRRNSTIVYRLSSSITRKRAMAWPWGPAGNRVERGKRCGAIGADNRSRATG